MVVALLAPPLQGQKEDLTNNITAKRDFEVIVDREILLPALDKNKDQARKCKISEAYCGALVHIGFPVRHEKSQWQFLVVSAQHFLNHH